NGGGPVVLTYTAPGLMPTQRQANAPWQDYARVDDVVMLPVDPIANVVQTGSVGLQVAQGSISSDADGTRRARVRFPDGNGAMMKFADGTQQALSTLTVHATEYTVGAAGTAAMPGSLPPASAYTYAVNLTVDEAAGATSVVFDSPVGFYVENFLGFPV